MAALVIDSNGLQTSDLSYFLHSSKRNKAVLTPPVMTEMLKVPTAEAYSQRVRIVSHHSDQVIVTKSLRAIARDRGRSKGLRKRLIDPEKTELFKSFRDRKTRIGLKPSDLQSLIQPKSIEAQNYITARTNDTADLAKAYVDLKSHYSDADIKKIRRGEERSVDFWHTFSANVLGLTEALTKASPDGVSFPNQDRIYYTYTYRFALFLNIHFVEWVKKGSPKKLNPSKITNDILDLQIGVFATFFDGLLTSDKTLQTYYSIANSLLTDILYPRKPNP